MQQSQPQPSLSLPLQASSQGAEGDPVEQRGPLFRQPAWAYVLQGLGQQPLRQLPAPLNVLLPLSALPPKDGRTKQRGQDGGDGGGFGFGIGERGGQNEGSTPLCLVLVTSLRLLTVMSVFLSVSGPLFTHTLLCVSRTFSVCIKASSRPGGTVCEWLWLLWFSHTTLVVLWYPSVRVLRAWGLNNQPHKWFIKKEVKTLWGSPVFSLYDPELLANVTLLWCCCDVTAQQEINESTP